MAPHSRRLGLIWPTQLGPKQIFIRATWFMVELPQHSGGLVAERLSETGTMIASIRE